MSERSVGGVLEGYAAAAHALTDRFEAISTATMLAPFVDLFPQPPARVADIGAGTGRDAAWFVEQGYNVLAVEPVAALREAGERLHPIERLRWGSEQLPELYALSEEFDLILLSGVWQHLDDEDRVIAMGRLSKLTVDRGLVLMSLRHGPGAPLRAVFDVSVDAMIDLAIAVGLRLERHVKTESMQAENRAAGVTWTWLAFRRLTG